MTAEIITVGDELLIGQIINTNQAYIAERMNAIGIDVRRMTTVGDDPAALDECFHAAWGRRDLVIVTGGLGPTHDDITKRAVARFFGSELRSNDEVRRDIAALLAKRGAPWGPSAEEQALFPAKAAIIHNPVGTAAGIKFEEAGKVFIVLPGVPYEMKEMIDRSVVPLLTPRAGSTTIRHLTLRTTGITESALSAALGDLNVLLQGARLAFLPSPTGVRLRITVHDLSADGAGRRVALVETGIRARVEEYIYGTDEEELEEVVGRLLGTRGATIAVAESCTGGRLADRLTNVGGSSAYFERGVVTYSNRAKTELLGVDPGLIARHGAVSEEVALEMARGVRDRSGTDIGLSTTGIAGPTGGTADKPVGLVWVGYADRVTSVARRYRFGEGRTRIKERAAQAAMEIVRRQLLGIPLPPA